MARLTTTSRSAKGSGKNRPPRPATATKALSAKKTEPTADGDGGRATRGSRPLNETPGKKAPASKSARSSATKKSNTPNTSRRQAGRSASAVGNRGSAAKDPAGRAPQRRRRSADPGQRRDPARTRQLILDAASEEFGHYGYDAARVIRIAERAGVAHQLITYHFGGKRGLFDALSDRWIAASTRNTEGSQSFAEALSRLVRQANEDQAWGRALVREGQTPRDHANLADRLAPMLANARERQARGELHADLDPGVVTLVFFAANMAPITIPHITRALSKVNPSDPEFVDYYAEQLGRVSKHLGDNTAS